MLLAGRGVGEGAECCWGVRGRALYADEGGAREALLGRELGLGREWGRELGREWCGRELGREWGREWGSEFGRE